MQRPHESAMAQPCKNNISCIYFAPIPSCFLPPRSFSCIYCASFPWLWCFARPSVLSLLATSLAAPQSSATTSSHFHVIFRGVKGSVRDWRMHNNTPPPPKKKFQTRLTSYFATCGSANRTTSGWEVSRKAGCRPRCEIDSLALILIHPCTSSRHHRLQNFYASTIE